MIETIIEEVIERVWRHARTRKANLLWLRYLFVTVVGLLVLPIFSSLLRFRISPVASDLALDVALVLWVLLGLWWFAQAIIRKKYFDATGVAVVGLLIWVVVYVLGATA